MNVKDSDNLLAYFYNTEKKSSVKEDKGKIDKGTLQHESTRKKLIVEKNSWINNT